MLDVEESLNFLKLNGLPVVQCFVVESESALRSVIERLSFPLVLKVNE